VGLNQKLYRVEEKSATAQYLAAGGLVKTKLLGTIHVPSKSVVNTGTHQGQGYMLTANNVR